MDDRLIARLVAAGRVLFGALCLAIPRVILGRPGREASGPMLYMVRAFGIRDIVLGTGALTALNGDEPDTRWVAFGAAADTADAVTAVAFREELGPALVGATLSLAIPAAVLGWKAVVGLRRS
jgi:hypothetical protein